MPRDGKAPVLTDAEWKRLLKVAAADDRQGVRNVALLTISFGLGVRVMEISRLSIGDVQDTQGQWRDVVNLRRRMTKGSKQCHAYLTNPRVRAAVDACLKVRSSDPKHPVAPTALLFLSNKGNQFSPNSLQQVFKRLYTAAGIEGASSHSGRRTFATRLIEKGVDIKAVSTLMGHATVAMTARYVEDNPARLRSIASEVL